MARIKRRVKGHGAVKGLEDRIIEKGLFPGIDQKTAERATDSLQQKRDEDPYFRSVLKHVGSSRLIKDGLVSGGSKTAPIVVGRYASSTESEYHLAAAEYSASAFQKRKNRSPKEWEGLQKYYDNRAVDGAKIPKFSPIFTKILDNVAELASEKRVDEQGISRFFDNITKDAADEKGILINSSRYAMNFVRLIQSAAERHGITPAGVLLSIDNKLALLRQVRLINNEFSKLAGACKTVHEATMLQACLSLYENIKNSDQEIILQQLLDLSQIATSNDPDKIAKFKRALDRSLPNFALDQNIADQINKDFSDTINLDKTKLPQLIRKLRRDTVENIIGFEGRVQNFTEEVFSEYESLVTAKNPNKIPPEVREMRAIVGNVKGVFANATSAVRASYDRISGEEREKEKEELLIAFKPGVSFKQIRKHLGANIKLHSGIRFNPRNGEVHERSALFGNESESELNSYDEVFARINVRNFDKIRQIHKAKGITLEEAAEEYFIGRLVEIENEEKVKKGIHGTQIAIIDDLSRFINSRRGYNLHYNRKVSSFIGRPFFVDSGKIPLSLEDTFDIRLDNGDARRVVAYEYDKFRKKVFLYVKNGNREEKLEAGHEETKTLIEHLLKQTAQEIERPEYKSVKLSKKVERLQKRVFGGKSKSRVLSTMMEGETIPSSIKEAYSRVTHERELLSTLQDVYNLSGAAENGIYPDLELEGGVTNSGVVYISKDQFDSERFQFFLKSLEKVNDKKLKTYAYPVDTTFIAIEGLAPLLKEQRSVYNKNNDAKLSFAEQKQAFDLMASFAVRAKYLRENAKEVGFGINIPAKISIAANNNPLLSFIEALSDYKNNERRMVAVNNFIEKNTRVDGFITAEVLVNFGNYINGDFSFDKLKQSLPKDILFKFAGEDEYEKFGRGQIDEVQIEKSARAKFDEFAKDLRDLTKKRLKHDEANVEKEPVFADFKSSQSVLLSIEVELMKESAKSSVKQLDFIRDPARHMLELLAEYQRKNPNLELYSGVSIQYVNAIQELFADDGKDAHGNHIQGIREVLNNPKAKYEDLQAAIANLGNFDGTIGGLAKKQFCKILEKFPNQDIKFLKAAFYAAYDEVQKVHQRIHEEEFRLGRTGQSHKTSLEKDRIFELAKEEFEKSSLSAKVISAAQKLQQDPSRQSIADFHDALNNYGEDIIVRAPIDQYSNLGHDYTAGFIKQLAAADSIALLDISDAEAEMIKYHSKALATLDKYKIAGLEKEIEKFKTSGDEKNPDSIKEYLANKNVLQNVKTAIEKETQDQLIRYHSAALLKQLHNMVSTGIQPPLIDELIQNISDANPKLGYEILQLKPGIVNNGNLEAFLFKVENLFSKEFGDEISKTALSSKVLSQVNPDILEDNTNFLLTLGGSDLYGQLFEADISRTEGLSAKIADIFSNMALNSEIVIFSDRADSYYSPSRAPNFPDYRIIELEDLNKILEEVRVSGKGLDKALKAMLQCGYSLTQLEEELQTLGGRMQADPLQKNREMGAVLQNVHQVFRRTTASAIRDLQEYGRDPVNKDTLLVLQESEKNRLAGKPYDPRVELEKTVTRDFIESCKEERELYLKVIDAKSFDITVSKEAFSAKVTENKKREVAEIQGDLVWASGANSKHVELLTKVNNGIESEDYNEIVNDSTLQAIFKLYKDLSSKILNSSDPKLSAETYATLYMELASKKDLSKDEKEKFLLYAKISADIALGSKNLEEEKKKFETEFAKLLELTEKLPNVFEDCLQERLDNIGRMAAMHATAKQEAYKEALREYRAVQNSVGDSITTLAQISPFAIEMLGIGSKVEKQLIPAFKRAGEKVEMDSLSATNQGANPRGKYNFAEAITDFTKKTKPVENLNDNNNRPRTSIQPKSVIKFVSLQQSAIAER